ncbi:MAG: hypothetical protein JST68_27650 [Bacteroidetes bacterium]|nr:hypothetical protein [Bacteroidota bacterium]
MSNRRNFLKSTLLPAGAFYLAPALPKIPPEPSNLGKKLRTLTSATHRDQAKPNPSFYIDYQDGQYIGNNEAVYTGLSAYKKPDGTRIAIGGIEVVNLEQSQPIHQVPVDLWSPSGTIITQNPSYFELNGETLRAYFMPDENDSTIFIYETTGQ